MAWGFREAAARPPLPPVEDGAKPFGSHGPHGHRGRMREKLLTAGAEALADYEVLEMLLFFGIPRRDTKPQAKAMINCFGSLAATLAAPPGRLRDKAGLDMEAVAALKLVEAAAARLARAEAVTRPLLNNWDRLAAYLDGAVARDPAPRRQVLYLDNRNRLLADEVAVADRLPLARVVAERALEVHATALILVHAHPPGPEPGPADVDLTNRVRDAAELLSIVLHDHVLAGPDFLVSLRREGLL